MNEAAEFRRTVIEPTARALVGKDEIVEVLAVALVARENAFLLGPPGTAKSALVQQIARRLGGRSFDYLLTRFTEPSELFGPFDLRRLRDGDLVTNTEGMLPEADFVFLDELFNANSAILNSLLLALNERVFRRGRETRPLPMLMAVGASNSLPEDEALSALYDRFLLRVRCDNVADDRLDEVLAAGWAGEAAAVELTLTPEVARGLQRRVPRVDLSDVSEPYRSLVRSLRDAGMPISDRRAVRMQRVVAASAVMADRDVADVSDLWVMEFIWDTPDQVEILRGHLDAVVPDDRPPAKNPHPMASRREGADPDAIAAMLDRIAADGSGGRTNADALSMAAARVQWVVDDGPRRHLTDRIAAMRGTPGE